MTLDEQREWVAQANAAQRDYWRRVNWGVEESVRGDRGGNLATGTRVSRGEAQGQEAGRMHRAPSSIIESRGAVEIVFNGVRP